MQKEPPDYPRKIELLEASVAHQVAVGDKRESEKARLLQRNRRLIGIVEELTSEKQVLLAEKQVWAEERFLLLEQVDLCKAIQQARQISEDANEATAILHAIIFHDRDSKRQKTTTAA